MEDKDVELSSRTSVTIRELNAFEAMKADAIAARFADGGQIDQNVLTKVYAICSVRKVNGAEVKPIANYAEFTATSEKISLSEMPALLNAFVEMLGAGDLNLKNASEAGPAAS